MSSLRRALVCGLACLAVVGGAAAAAQAPAKKYPLYSADDFVTAMKPMGRAFGAVNAAVAANDFETAKAQLVRSREQLAITITFWRDRQKDDAVRMLRATVSKMDELDGALSAASIDAASVGALVKQVGAGCQGCHAAYREQDPATKAFKFKLDTAR